MIGANILAVLFAASGWADDFSGMIMGCGKREEKQLRTALEDTRAIVQGCLVDAKLNATIGAQLLGALEERRVAFSCEDDGGGYAGVTRTTKDGKEIALVAWPPPEFKFLEDDEYAFTVFHELIHAASPKTLMVDVDLHNTGRFPDAVYGCENACRHRLVSRKFLTPIAFYEKVAGEAIPEIADWACEGLKDECAALRKQAWLCRNGPFKREEILKESLPMQEVLCAFDTFEDKCSEEPCKKAYGVWSGDLPAPEAEKIDVILRLWRIYQASKSDEWTKLPAADQAFGHALSRSGVWTSCAKTIAPDKRKPAKHR